MTPTAPVQLERSCVCALCIAVFVTTLLPLTCLPGSIENDFPTTLRSTSLVLIALLSSPPLLSKPNNFVVEQRTVLAFLVAAAASAGENKAEFAARAVDSLFVFVALAACVMSSVSNGLGLVARSNNDKMRQTNENMCSLFGALLFYIGARLVRDSFAIPAETLSFTTTRTDFRVRGFALVDEMTIATKAINGTLFASVGAIVLLKHNDVLNYGVTTVAKTCRGIACLTFTTTFVSNYVSFHNMTLLPSIFSDNACLVGDACDVAARSRRQYISSSVPFVSLAATLALGVFSLPSAHQNTLRKHSTEPTLDCIGAVAICFGVAAVVPILVILSYAAMDVSQLEIELILSLVAIASIASNSTIVGLVLYLISSLLHVTRAGFDTNVVTDLAYLASILICFVILVLTSINTALYATADRLFSDPLEMLCGSAITFLLSLNLLIFMGSLVLFASATGALRTSETTLVADGLTFYLEHYAPVFFAGSLFAIRHECSTLNFWVCRLFYFVPTILFALIYAILTSVRVNSSGGDSISYAGYDPIEAYVDVFCMAVGTTAAVACWAGLGVFL